MSAALRAAQVKAAREMLVTILSHRAQYFVQRITNGQSPDDVCNIKNQTYAGVEAELVRGDSLLRAEFPELKS